jgi:hypothetical protein
MQLPADSANRTEHEHKRELLDEHNVEAQVEACESAAAARTEALEAAAMDPRGADDDAVPKDEYVVPRCEDVVPTLGSPSLLVWLSWAEIEPLQG